MRKTISYILLFEAILLLSIVCLYFFVPNGYNSSLFLYNFIIAGIVLYFQSRFSYFLSNEQKIDYWLRPSFIFIVGYLIVGYQLFFDVYIGFLSKDADLLITPKMLNKGVCFSSIGLLAFSMGYLAVQNVPRNISSNKTKYPFLLILNIVLFLFFLTAVDSEMLSGETYAGSAEDETIASEYLLNLIQFSIIAQHSINIDDKISFPRWILKMPHLFVITLAIYLGIRIMSGDRGPVIYSLLALILGYTYSTRVFLKKKFIILLGIAGMLTMTLVGLSRALVSTSLSEKLSFGMEAYKTVGNISISPLTMELAGSVRCNQLALKDINLDNSDYHYGEFQLRYLGSILVTNRVVESLFPTKRENTGSADYFTVKFFDDGNIRFGLGSSCTADLFLDFGIIGMLICMSLIGSIFKKIDGAMLDSNNKNTSYIWVCLIIGLGSYAIYLPRSIFIFLLRIPLYMFVILYFNKLFTYRMANNQSQTSIIANDQ